MSKAFGASDWPLTSVLSKVNNWCVYTSAKRPLGRPRGRWEDNFKMDLQEVGRGCADWMELVQDRDRWRAFVSRVMKFRFP